MKGNSNALSVGTFLTLWAAALIGVFMLQYSRGELGMPAAKPASPAGAASARQPQILSPSPLAAMAADSVPRGYIPMDMTPLAGKPVEVQALAKMRPKAAGAIIDTLTEEDAIYVLAQMNGREAAYILESLAPDASSRLLTALITASRAKQQLANAATVGGGAVPGATGAAGTLPAGGTPATPPGG
jgi:hypothetical protein